MREQPPTSRPADADDWRFFRRLLIALAVAALAFIVWKTAAVLILGFAAVLIAILLAGAADFLARNTFLTARWALASVVLILALLLGGVVVLFGTQISGQVTAVFGRVPQALDSLGELFDVPDLSKRIVDAVSSGSGGQLFSQLANFGYTLIGGIADLVLVLIAAVYLAADPTLYRRGTAKLFAPDEQEVVLETMNVAAAALRFWFLGQLASMVLVGSLSALAFWIIGLPSALGLGLIAGITNFVPLLGPIVGALPALLIAFNQDGNAILWTVAAILVIQQIEGNLIMPIIQQHAVSIPPAIILFAIVVFGTLFGLLGVVLAVPLAVLTMVLVQKIWIRETLGEDTAIAGERKA